MKRFYRQATAHLSGPQERILRTLLWTIGIIFGIFGPYFIGNMVQDIWHEENKITPLSWMIGLMTCMVLTLSIVGLYHLIYWIRTGESP